MLYRLGETWIDEESLAYDVPLSRSARRGLVRFPDGALRTVRLGVPDTMFSIPARTTRGHHGFVSIDTDANEFHYYGRLP